MITRNLKEKTKSLLSQEEQKELESLLKKKGYPYISYLVKKASELENTEREVDLVVWEKLLRISNLTKSRESIIDCSYYIERREGNKEVNLIKNPPSSEF